MLLNTIAPKHGAKKDGKRVGRGIGSGLGKTCGRGHKGQKSRAGGYHKVGFEGGQMPIQRRLPKRGFRSPIQKFTAEVSLATLSRLDEKQISLQTLLERSLVPFGIKKVKVVASGELKKAVHLMEGIVPTAGAKKAIEAAGGQVSLSDPK